MRNPTRTRQKEIIVSPKHITNHYQNPVVHEKGLQRVFGMHMYTHLVTH